MALFGKKRVEMRSAPSLGSGRRLSSAQSIEACLSLLEEIIWSYREPQYPEMPAYFYPGWIWQSEESECPDEAVCCDDSQDDFLVITFRTLETNVEIGMFPLGSGDDRLQDMPIIGHWKQRDPSLSSTGTFPGRLITLAPPMVEEDYCAELIGQRNFPPTDHNLFVAWSIVCQMFLLKSMQFIQSQDRRSADIFVARHKSSPAGSALAQQILDELAEANYGILPYMQDIPMRIRALLLSSESGSPWDELQR